jgi:hypothetical protein
MGARADAGDLAIRNVLLAKTDNSDDTAVMAITIVNNGQVKDTLTAVELAAPTPTSTVAKTPAPPPTETEAPVTAEMHPGVIVLQPGATVVVPTDPRPTIQIETDAPMGIGIDLVLRFDVAGIVTIRVPIVKAAGTYATLTPTS